MAKTGIERFNSSVGTSSGLKTGINRIGNKGREYSRGVDCHRKVRN